LNLQESKQVLREGALGSLQTGSFKRFTMMGRYQHLRVDLKRW